MQRRSWLVAGVLALANVAAGQTTSAPPRPEALLPDETILYVGTDDMETMLAKGRASPIGKILAEQEVKDFLEKPHAELRKMIEGGLAAARQNPAFADVNLDVDKLLAGPYGRAFIAVTHVQLPPLEKFDPSAIDLGIVIGLEPRQGAVDVIGLIRQIIGGLAKSEGEGEHAVKIETITGDDLSYDRVQAPGGAPPLCFAKLGGVSVISLSERALADMAKRSKSGGASLQANAAFSRSVANAGAATKGDLVVFMQVGKMMDLLHQGLDLGLTMNGEQEAVAIVDKIFEVSKISSLGPVYGTSTWRDGVAVSTSYAEVDPAAGGLCALMNPKPIDIGALKFIPKDALSFTLGSFELGPLWDVVMQGLQEAAPAIHEQVMTQVHAFETQAAGADDQGKPKWDIRRDLIGALAGRYSVVSTPGAASMFGPGGDIVFSLETPNPQGLDQSLKYLFSAAGQLLGNPITFKEQLHGDVKLQVLDAMSLGQAAMLAGSLQITYAFAGDRFWFSTSTKALKKALDARTTPPAENITAKADFASHYVEPPKGAVLTELSYGDTAANFESTYTTILGVIPMMLMGMQSNGMGELPVDLSLLPTAETISKHLFGTVTVGYGTGQNGHVTVSRGPFGAETGVAVVAGAAAVGILVAGRAETAKAAERQAEEAAHAEKKAGGPMDRVRGDLSDLSTAITVYTIENGKPPPTLDELIKPTADYPTGMLVGATSLPVDPWGHAYAYKTEGAEGYVIWSLGPNGVDDGGASDDVVQRGG